MFNSYWKHIGALTVLVLLGTLCSCGGGGKHLAPVPDPGSNVVTQVPREAIEFLPAPAGHGLKVPVVYSYDYSGFPSQQGFTIVPMADEFTPKSVTSASDFTMLVSDTPAGKRINIAAKGSSSSLIHLRYDPTIWQVDGIGIMNPFPDSEDCVSFSRVAEDGLAIIYAIPTDSSSASIANGDFASVFLKPKDAARTMSAGAPEGENVMAIGFLVTGSPVPTVETFGAVYYNLDGHVAGANELDYGNYSSKDGLLSTDEYFPYAYDNGLHDIYCSYFGSTFTRGGDFPTLRLIWTERMVGDYDQNGEVNLSDITPIALLGMPDDDAHAQGVLINGLVNGEIENMLENQLNPLWLNESPKILYSYRHYTTDWPEPASFYSWVGVDDPLVPGSTWARTGVDGFYDGYIADWKNWDHELPLDGIPDDYYDGHDTGPGGPYYYTNPGDVTSIDYHFQERIDGYKIWTVHNDNGDYFDPSSPPSDTNMNILSISRDFTGPGGYNTRPWIDGVGLEKFQKADISHLLTEGSFIFNELGWYDVMVAPFALIDGNESYGVVTRLRKVVEYFVDTTNDFYGPVYPGMTDDSEEGIVDDTAVVNPRVVDYTNFTFTVWDADDRTDIDPVNYHENTFYKVYAYVVPEDYQGDPDVPVANTLWEPGNEEGNLIVLSDEPLIDGWWENSVDPPIPPIPPLHRESPIWDLSVVTGLPIKEVGRKIWFGIRAWDTLLDPEVIENDPEITDDPNENMIVYTVKDMTPPYFTCPEDFYSGAVPGPIEREPLFRPIPQNNSVVVMFHPAYDPKNEGLPGAANMNYRVYWTTDEFFDWTNGNLPPAFVSTGPLAFDDFYDPSGAPLPGLNPPASRAYSAVISGLGPGQEVDFRIAALDDAATPNEFVYDNTYDSHARLSVYPGQIILATGLDGGNTSSARRRPTISGDIKALTNSIEVLYPAPNVGGFNWAPPAVATANLRYLHIPNGTVAFPGGSQEILVDDDVDRILTENWEQSSLGFTMNGSGDFIESDIAGHPRVGVAYPGTLIFQEGLTGFLKLCTIQQNQDGLTWPRNTLHAQLGDNGGPMSPQTSAPSLLSYQHYTGAAPLGTYFLAWIWEQGIGETLTAQLRIKVEPSTNPFWLPDEAGSNNSPIFTFPQPGFAGFGRADVAPDIIVRDIGRPSQEDWNAATLDGTQTGNLAFSNGNRLYMLANSRFVSWLGSTDSYQAVTIFWSDTLTDPGIPQSSDWNQVDFRALATGQGGWCQLGDPNQLNDSDTVGPNSLEVVGDVIANHAMVYVVFSNELPLFDCLDNDNRGLRVAAAEDTGNGLPGAASGWTSPETGDMPGVIDTTYFYPMKMADARTKMGSNDVVDLRKMPSADAANEFSGLGCAYIHPSGSLYLSENVTGDSWVKRIVQPVSGYEPIEDADILWVKLVYSSDGIPYVLFCRDDDNDQLYDIVLWSSTFP